MLLVPITAIYYYFTHGWVAAIVSALVMTVTGFLLSAVGGYLVGLVGSSNQPVSGLTLSALVIAALVLLAIGVKGPAGVAAVLGVAAVVCCACSVSGSLIQDLKAGHLLGGTPWKMQVVEIIAVILLAFFLMRPIIVLHEANLATGGIGGRALPAPQAGLMAQLAKGIVGGQMAWGLLGIGAAFGMALILCGARAPMLIAVGMYLPFDTSSAIFAGRAAKGRGGQARRTLQRRGKGAGGGERHAAGLRPDRGEAIVGILLAVLFVSGVPSAHARSDGRKTPLASIRSWAPGCRFSASRAWPTCWYGMPPRGPKGLMGRRKRLPRYGSKRRPGDFVHFEPALGARSNTETSKSGLGEAYWRKSIRISHLSVTLTFTPPP